MFSPNQQMPLHPKLLNVQVPSPVNYVGPSDLPYGAMDGGANSALSQAESVVFSSKKLEDELLLLGQNIKHHEENIKHLKAHINSLDDQITDMRVTHGKRHSMIEDKDFSIMRNEQAVVERIMQHDKSAAGIVCQMKYHGTQADPTSFTNSVLGVVATLGKVDDDNLSRLLSEYLGLETMLALVCITYDRVEALEAYDERGFISKSYGLHGVGASIGRPIDGRYNVICLENLRPYVGEFVPDDPQRKLALLKPRLPNGETPAGFLGFAVNMIHVDSAHLFSLTTNGHGIRETLFYMLFSRLQVYRTRAHMQHALPLISHGAISLDGGIIRSDKGFVFGDREEMDVKFAIRSHVPEYLVEIEKQIEDVKWKMASTMEELQREEAILTQAKFNFQVKKQEFVRFMAQSSQYAMQMQYLTQATPRRSTPRGSNNNGSQ